MDKAMSAFNELFDTGENGVGGSRGAKPAGGSADAPAAVAGAGAGS